MSNLGPIDLGPIAGGLVEARYGISASDWLAFDASERALFRMAFAADVWHLEEIPRGSNSGAEVNRVQHMAGTQDGQPWCASIWTAYLMDSGVKRADLPALAASVHGWGSWAAQTNRLVGRPLRGSAGLIYHTETTGHLVVVNSVGSTSVETISGNTNDDGSREGYGVFRRHYPISAFSLFVNCRDLIQP